MAAISDIDSKKEFYLSEMSNLNSFHVDSKDLKNYNKILVNSYSLVSLLKGRKIDLIRMDVEGHEVSIFKSLLEYINWQFNIVVWCSFVFYKTTVVGKIDKPNC